MFSSLLGIALLSLATAVASSHHSPVHRRHGAIADAVKNASQPLDEAVSTIGRRGETFYNARLTYYEVGLGACGKTNVPSDFIVALNSPMYGGGYPGPNCFRPIAITYNGKTANAVIMDECPGCPGDGGLDLSEGLFSYLAPLSDGVLYATWSFTDGGSSGNGGGNDPTTSSHTTPKPTTTHKTTPTTTWEAPTTTWEAPTTTSTHSSTHSTTTSSTPTTTSHSSTPSPTPSPSPSTSSSSSDAPLATVVDSLEKLNQAFVGMVDLMLGAAQVAA